MKRIVPDDAILLPPSAERVFKGQIFDVYQWPQRLFDGSEATFEMLKRPDTVVFLAIKDEKIIFIHEQQPNRGEYTRLPGGRVDEGEDWLTAAKRECVEEIGMEFQRWRLVSVRQPIAKIEWFVTMYIATDFVAERPVARDPGEKIQIVPMSFEAAKTHVLATNDPLNAYTRSIFKEATSLEDIENLPAFQGKEIA